MKVSQAEKIRRFDELLDRASLLERYFWDSRKGVKPDVHVLERTLYGDKCSLSVYQTSAAHGGYVVMEWDPGTPALQWFEKFSIWVNGLPYAGEHDLLMHRALGQLQSKLAAQEVQK